MTEQPSDRAVGCQACRAGAAVAGALDGAPLQARARRIERAGALSRRPARP